MEKKSIIEKCLNLITSKRKFEEESIKFKEKHPESYIHGNFSEKIKGKVFLYNNNFFIPTRVIIEKDKPLIECSKFGLFSWSVGSLNKISLQDFEYFKEVDGKEISDFCNKFLKKNIKGIFKLEEDVLKELKKLEDKSEQQ